MWRTSCRTKHFKARNAIVDVDTEQFGTLKMQNCVPKMYGTPGEIKWAGAPLGKFNEEVYGESWDLRRKTWQNSKRKASSEPMTLRMRKVRKAERRMLTMGSRYRVNGVQVHHHGGWTGDQSTRGYR